MPYVSGAAARELAAAHPLARALLHSAEAELEVPPGGLSEYLARISQRDRSKRRAELRSFFAVGNTRWYVCTVGPHVHTLEHFVTFADEAAWGRYRKEISRRGQDPAWERRRVSQDDWWEPLEARLLNDPPVEMPADPRTSGNGDE
jgi:hypothetical protein